MEAKPSTDDPVRWCRERLLVPGHPLSLTIPYAEPERRDELVALNTLVGEIAAVAGEVADPDIARRKLDWWREALSEGLPHPAVRAWLTSGAGARVGPDDFDALFAAVAAEIDPPRFERVESFERHCRNVAGAAALLETRLIESGQLPAGEPVRQLEVAAGAGYRARIARDVVLDARQQRWLIPLEVQAEFQVTRQDVATGTHSRKLDALVRHLAGGAVLDIDRALDALPARFAWRHRHLLLRLHLDRRIGVRLVRRPSRVTRERIAVGGPVDALSTWRLARRLRRRASRRAASD
ncbi:MAG: squalene/phytoene synthase family protein [Candidatus Wenzhouxiangella sp. M2_3B_020]